MLVGMQDMGQAEVQHFYLLKLTCVEQAAYRKFIIFKKKSMKN